MSTYPSMFNSGLLGTGLNSTYPGSLSGTGLGTGIGLGTGTTETSSIFSNPMALPMMMMAFNSGNGLQMMPMIMMMLSFFQSKEETSIEIKGDDDSDVDDCDDSHDSDDDCPDCNDSCPDCENNEVYNPFDFDCKDMNGDGVINNQDIMLGGASGGKYKPNW